MQQALCVLHGMDGEREAYGRLERQLRSCVGEEKGGVFETEA
jgi:hypothetical protein